MKAILTLENGETLDITVEDKDIAKALEIKHAKEVAWKPEDGDNYWAIESTGSIVQSFWIEGTTTDNSRYAVDNVYKSRKEAETARDLLLARTRLRRSSTHTLNLAKSGEGEQYYVVYWNIHAQALQSTLMTGYYYGDIATYASDEDAQQAIEKYRDDWLLHFGVKEEK